MLDKLEGVEQRFVKLEELLSDAEVIKDQEAFRQYSREHAELSKIVSIFREYKQVAQDIAEGTGKGRHPELYGASRKARARVDMAPYPKRSQ